MTKKTGTISGEVMFSAGDGAQQPIPKGPCEIETTSQDATIGWTRDGVTGSAAMPIDVYTTYLSEGKIVVE